MLFALQAPYSTFCKDGPTMVKWKKTMPSIKIKIYCAWLKPKTILLSFGSITQLDVL